MRASNAVSDPREASTDAAPITSATRASSRARASASPPTAAGTVAADQVSLELGDLARRNAHVGELSEPGGHAVHRGVAPDGPVHDPARGGHRAARGRRERRTRRPARDGDEVVERQVVAGQFEKFHATGILSPRGPGPESACASLRCFSAATRDTDVKVLAVLGGQWGDEGKGKLVDLLADRFDVVARYHGGHNAGHTVKFDNQH